MKTNDTSQFKTGAIRRFFRDTKLNNTLILGYYGGGNFGDELLMEVVVGLIKKAEHDIPQIGYLSPDLYSTYHSHDVDRVVNMKGGRALLHAILNSKHIIVGGGGLWGLDFNKNVLLLSFLLFLASCIPGKHVHLIGVGYYSSTSRFGHIGAWLASVFASTVIGRDQETVDNFLQYNSKAERDCDLAFYLDETDLLNIPATNTLYRDTPFIFLSLRRFSPRHTNDYTRLAEQIIVNNPARSFVVTLLEDAQHDSQNDALLNSWVERYSNVTRMPLTPNPIQLLAFLRDHRSYITMISPQFHTQISAMIYDIPFVAISYDNKNTELFTYVGEADFIDIYNMKLADLQQKIETS